MVDVRFQQRHRAQATLEVARRGGVIHMVCRNEEAAKKARSEVITTTGNDKIHLHVVDLSRPREVVVWAQRFAAQHEKLHVLIHNAGCMLHERQVDEDGVECNFAVNTLAVHILTLIMMPLLERSEEPRVVMVSSAGLLCVRLDPIDLMHASLDPFIGNLVYSQNKRQQVVMTLWYAQRYNKVHFASMHPGWADTPAVRTSMPQFFETMKDNLRSPSQGADTVVWLAISKAALKHPSGLFFQDREPVSTHFPLAWTKTSIEEEDLLMNNIQTVYTQIHSKIFSDGATPLSTPHSAPTTSTPHSAPTTSTPETAPQNTTGDKNENTSEQKTEESDTTQHPVPVETGPVTFPVLRPPPPPAEEPLCKGRDAGGGRNSCPTTLVSAQGRGESEHQTQPFPDSGKEDRRNSR
ncbi:Dehydrogenase/reductase SDR family member 12 [Chionoecetes opilio]|uniref:Dehydrogenase/reductase SDR family member 12 n=1 Tax=Chionoecetes opilio TaxID=41210 RepID=A0A8J8WLN6_CHIOP|nr:Dehydrogenase/reductase SDR family member 12 [Chionoecetes opilio]